MEKFRKGKQVAFGDLESGKTYFYDGGRLFDFVARSKRDNLYAFVELHEKNFGATLIHEVNEPFYEALPQRECWICWVILDKTGDVAAATHQTEAAAKTYAKTITWWRVLHIQRVVYDGADE